MIRLDNEMSHDYIGAMKTDHYMISKPATSVYLYG